MSFDGQGPPAGPNQFTETAVLYAVMNDDHDGATGLVGTMMDGELNDFYRQVSRTLDLVVAELRTRRARPGVIL